MTLSFHCARAFAYSSDVLVYVDSQSGSLVICEAQELAIAHVLSIAASSCFGTSEMIFARNRSRRTLAISCHGILFARAIASSSRTGFVVVEFVFV